MDCRHSELPSSLNLNQLTALLGLKMIGKPYKNRTFIPKNTRVGGFLSYQKYESQLDHNTSGIGVKVKKNMLNNMKAIYLPIKTKSAIQNFWYQLGHDLGTAT